MVDNRKISLCITTWNRDTMTVNSYSQVVDDDRIGEVVIVDDCSSQRYVDRLKNMATQPKVRLFLNQKNIGCYRNKKHAIEQAKYEYVIILDSDNKIDKSYLDAIYSQQWSKDTILAPEFARPHFNYQQFADLVITGGNIKKYIPDASNTRFDCLINCMNYFVNRDEYIRIWDGSIEPWTADTIYHNYNWLKAGNKIKVVRGMQYDHDIHQNKTGSQEGSHYQKYVMNTGNLYKDIEQKMMKLC